MCRSRFAWATAFPWAWAAVPRRRCGWLGSRSPPLSEVSIGMPRRSSSRRARLEGHPDNVAACWHGGLTIAASARAARHRLHSAAPGLASFPGPSRDPGGNRQGARHACPQSYDAPRRGHERSMRSLADRRFCLRQSGPDAAGYPRSSAPALSCAALPPVAGPAATGRKPRGDVGDA